MIDKRDEVFDFIKGILVIGMVIYHSFNYFTLNYSLVFEYFSFVARGFILISGFICGAIYYQKYQENRQYVLRRLPIRFLKLIAIFLVINIGIGIISGKIGFGNNNAEISFVDWAMTVFLHGSPYTSNFEILVPIAYVLIVAPLFFQNIGFKSNLIYVILLAYIIISLLKIDLGYNLHCFLIGIGGISIGLIYNRIYRFINNKYFQIAATISIFIIYAILIPEGFSIRQNIFVVFVHICIVIINLYSLGRLLDLKGFFPSQVTLIGRYSLMLYIGQIILLRLLRVALGTTFLLMDKELWIIIIAVNIAMVFFALLVEKIRKKSRNIERLYRLIFA